MNKKNILSAALCFHIAIGGLYISLPANAADSIKLTENKTIGATTVIEQDTVYDLNGYTLEFNGNSGSVFYVKKGYTLTIVDSSTAKTGKITGGKALMTSENAATFNDFGSDVYLDETATCGGGVYVENDAKLIINGGTITGNCAEQGGGVFLESGAELHLSGNASIYDNYREKIGSVQDNVWIPLDTKNQQSYIIIDNFLNTEAKIGITTAMPISMKTLTFSKGLNQKGSSSNFTSDEGFSVALDQSKEACLTVMETLPTAKSLTYNGSAQKLITAGKAVKNYSLEYAVTNSNTATAPTNGWTQNAEKITAVSAGTYKIWYRIKEEDYTPTFVTAMISSPSVATKFSQCWTLTMESYTYDGTAHEVAINGTTVGKVIYYYYNADTDELLDEAPSEAGNYRVRVYTSGSSSYYSRSQSVEYTISEVPAPSMYSVTVKNGTIDGKTSGEFAPNTVIAVKADKAKSGYQFGYWKRSNATASYNSTYTFPVTSDNIELEAVYLEADDEFTTNGKCDKDSVTIDKENKKIAFAFLNNVPENCTIVKGGVVATSDISKLNDLAVGIGSNKEKTTFEKVFTTTKHNYKYTWTKGSIADGQAWYVRGYLIYKDADGKEITVYSNIEKATLNGSETIHDDKVVGTAVMDSVTKDTANKKMVFTSLLNVPADCTIKFAGIVSTSDAKKAENLTAVTVAEKTVTDGIYVRGMESTKHTVKYSWTKTNVGTEIWYVRPYLVYTDALGTEQIVYGELTTAKLN